MPIELQTRIDSIRRKAGLLTQRLSLLEEVHKADVRRIEELEEALRSRERELEQARRQLEYDTMVASIAPTADDVRRMRLMLAGLVSDIDRCIADLSD